MFNPVIVVAIIVQVIVAKFSRIAGAVIGYIITTGILLWGISVYGQGNRIALFGIPLSQPIFLIACLVWYWFDTREFMAARKKASEIEQVLQSPLIQDEHVDVNFPAKIEVLTPDEMELRRIKKEYEPKGQSVQRVVGITVCPNCKMKVVPKFDGTCPSCQSKIM